MLFRVGTYDGIASGEVTLAFRRWTRPTVRQGGTLVTRVGVLAIDALDIIDPDDITAEDVRRAGHDSRDDVLAMLAEKDAGDVYRVSFHLAGADPRIALRDRDDLSADDVAALTTRLGRLDARPTGAWTDRVLRLIGEREAVRAGDLAAELGMERLAFKTDVRKLKALGLTESLGTGYRLAPRGRAWLDR
jgi:biotin operon repressor